jgi:retinol dehydrogenase-12
MAPYRPSIPSAMFPPAPKFTDKNLPSLTGKVYIVTGAASGMGCEFAQIVYAAGGTVYVAARSESRCNAAIEKMQEQSEPRCKGPIKKTEARSTTRQATTGKLRTMFIDLADLATVKPAAEAFLKAETRLDVLFHNAGVMTPPAGSKDSLVSFENLDDNRHDQNAKEYLLVGT